MFFRVRVIDFVCNYDQWLVCSTPLSISIWMSHSIYTLIYGIWFCRNTFLSMYLLSPKYPLDWRKSYIMPLELHNDYLQCDYFFHPYLDWFMSWILLFWCRPLLMAGGMQLEKVQVLGFLTLTHVVVLNEASSSLLQLGSAQAIPAI